MISRSDLIGLIPQSVFTVFRQVCGLRSIESKLTLPPFSLELVFDRRKEISPAHRWLVSCITTVATEVATDLMLDTNPPDTDATGPVVSFAGDQHPWTYEKRPARASAKGQ